jgi:hypothetical protein
MRGPGDHSYKQTWVYLTAQPERRVCYIDGARPTAQPCPPQSESLLLSYYVEGCTADRVQD